MRNDDWHGLGDDALERLLIERWLYRGLLLAIMLVSAILVTWLLTRDPVGTTEHVTIAVVAAVAVGAAVVSFVMRSQDLRIHSELRRRRRSSP